jgi:hypothetical protein
MNSVEELLSWKRAERRKKGAGMTRKHGSRRRLASFWKGSSEILGTKSLKEIRGDGEKPGRII